MHKIKYYPDVAFLLMRFVTGVGFLFLLYPFADYLMKNGMTQEIQLRDVIEASILFIASIFLMLGLYSRWTTAVIVVTLLVVGFMGMPPLGDLTFNIFFRFTLAQLTSVLVPLSLWLLGAGKYSLDYKIWKRS